MSCEAVREVLPLVADADEADVALVRGHIAHCAACREVHEDYERDARLLGSLSQGRRVPAGLMDGFSQGVLDALAAEPGRTAAPVALGERRPEGRLIRFSPGAAVAAAAALLFVVTLSVATRAPVPSGGVAGTEPTSERPRAEEPAADVQLAVEGPAPAAEALPAPRRVRDHAPMPRRVVRRSREREVVPVGQGNRARPQVDLQDIFERTLPGLRRLFEPPAERDEDEVRF